jgi:hypothetical protein
MRAWSKLCPVLSLSMSGVLIILSNPAIAGTSPPPAPVAALTSQPRPTAEVPDSMKAVDCGRLLTWLNTAAPALAEKQRIQADIFAATQAIRAKSAASGSLSRRAYAEGNRIFENLLSMLASGYDPGKIEDQIAIYISPAFDQAKIVAGLAKQIHDSFQAQTPDLTARANLIKQYKLASQKLGVAYSRYSMIMETLVSVASGHGILDVKTARKSPSPTATQNSILVYDLTSPEVAETARTVLQYLDRENSSKGIPQVEPDADAGDQDLVPYPSLQVVKTIFKNDLYAILANRQWTLAQQNYSSRPWVWLTQFISDTAVNVTSGIPDGLRPLARTLSGIGNADSMSTSYLPDILDIAGTTRFADEKGNMVITTDSYFVNLQLDRLFDGNGNANDDEITTFARLLWHRKVWAAMVNEMAKQAGVEVSSRWTPKELQDSVPAAKQDDQDDDQDSKGDKTKGTKDKDVVVPNAPPSVTPSSSASQVAAYRLVHMLKAEQEADRLGPIPFAAPKTARVALRFALVQLTSWGILSGQIYQHWPWIHDHLITTIMPFLH